MASSRGREAQARAGRRRTGRVGVRCLMACCLGLLLGPTAAAQPVDAPPEVRVIIDVSGSMRENDPERLSASALELLVSLLPEGTLAGVWTFGETVANPLPRGEVDNEWREQARRLRPRLAGAQPYTDIEAAVRAAADPEAEGWRHLVLLTDGVIDLPPARGPKPEVDAASRQRLLQRLAPRLADAGVVVHAIAFSGQADMGLVASLSRTTGGLPAQVVSPESLLGAFLDIVERIYPADRIPLEAGRFVVEPGVEAFSALLFHAPDAEPLTLVAPDGREYDAEAPPPNGRWQPGTRFDLLRVPEPMPGEWRVVGEIGADSRIGVASALALNTGALPATAFLGLPLPVEAWLTRHGVPFEGELAGLSLGAELTDADGRVQSAIRLEREGERFRGTLPAPALPGTARLTVRAEAEGFTRERVQAINLLAPLTAHHEPANRRVVLEARHPELDHGSARPWAELDGERLAVEPLTPRRWAVALPELDASIRRPLLLGAEVELGGETRELRLPRLVLFAEAATGLDLAASEGELAAERFHEDLAVGRDAAPEGRVARLVEGLNAWVAVGVTHWREAWQPRLAELARRPQAWAAAAGVALLVLLAWRWRARRDRRHQTHREDPHV
ncbi:TIGR03503 family protein [Halomonas shengliensis]|uniref:TIGR03503 family protein n=1 Tax=Halomonas shengliensis TaxID=419597 RepID=A0A1H0IA80_9GAMM|nr:vWA domain-containing protein [Halomonas shengliensis]SDO28312.1 TIGR03503 family protein [Halomonas shengliensis]